MKREKERERWERRRESHVYLASGRAWDVHGSGCWHICDKDRERKRSCLSVQRIRSAPKGMVKR